MTLLCETGKEFVDEHFATYPPLQVSNCILFIAVIADVLHNVEVKMVADATPDADKIFIKHMTLAETKQDKMNKIVRISTSTTEIY